MSQPHTFTGDRGKYQDMISLRMIYDAVQEGIRLSCGADSFDQVDLEGVDPIAISQNTCCEIERQLGIYPNIPKP